MTAPFLAFLFVLPLFSVARAAEEDQPPSPVVVELFTSQGCSSCPPADAYLGDLAKRDDILALGFHVDYWNYIGWTDPYSLQLATRRQRDYAGAMNLNSVYTPQMVVDGVRQGVGSDRAEIDGLIRAAAEDFVPHPILTLVRSAEGGLVVHIDGQPSGIVAGDEPATVWLTAYDSEHTTVVARGENGGRTLKDYQVVRSFRPIGSWTGAPLDIVVPAKDLTLGTGGVAVLLQTNGVGPIIAATTLKLAN
ncbi:MAG: DUF1223 domain-containing protein [Methyloceanibacter sp.]